MFYGILFESARDGVIHFYGEHTWRRVVQELQLPSDTFNIFERYNHTLLLNICMAHLQGDGTAASYLEFFGRDFVRFFVNFGFDKILRVAGRTLRDFLFAIDQLHDSNRFTFPHMVQPLFHVTVENENGATLDYKSTRHGFSHYAIGGLKAAAKTLFQQDIEVETVNDSSTREYTHIVFWIKFSNESFHRQCLNSNPVLPDLHSSTFFRVFPFSILMDSKLCIRQVGKHILKIFPQDSTIVGRPLNEIFRLIRPDIYVEWDKILSYGRHIVFLMENRISLRTGLSGRIRLKGQMKYLRDQNMLWFLCHPVLGSADDMISAGLHLTDLNLFDSTSDLLITGIHQERKIEDAIAQQHVWLAKLQESKSKLMKWRQKSQRLLNSILPKHIVVMLQSGIQPNCICESHPLVTVLFVYLMDLNALSFNIDPPKVVECLNTIISAFDKIDDKYDVFKIETKADASYMVVGGLKDRTHMGSSRTPSPTMSLMDDFHDDEDGDIDEIVDKNSKGLHQTEIIAGLALDLLDASQHIINPITNEPFRVKIGFHSGSAVGGIVGKKNIQYCLFGDTINMASRITTSSEIGRIHLSHSSYNHLSGNHRFNMEHRGHIELKGKGTCETYWLTGMAIKPSLKNVINNRPSVMMCPFSANLTTDVLYSSTNFV